MLQRDSILKDEGDEHILQRSMEQGNSVVCVRCGDLVAKDRWKQHKKFWCSKIDGLDDIEEDDEGQHRGGSSTVNGSAQGAACKVIRRSVYRFAGRVQHIGEVLICAIDGLHGSRT